MAAYSGHTLDGWMSFSFRPAWPFSAPEPDALPSAFLHPPPPPPLIPPLKCDALKSQAVRYDSGNWSEDGKFTLTLSLNYEAICFQ